MKNGGAKRDKFDQRDFRLGGIMAPEPLPPSFRLSDPYPVKDQNRFGSCTGQATSTHKQMQEGVELSARFTYAMTKKLEGNTEWGAYTRNAFKVITDVGAVTESQYPETHNFSEATYLDWNLIPSDLIDSAKEHRSKKYWRIEPNAEAIKQAIYKYKQAVVISVPWYRSYMTPDGNGYLVLDKSMGTAYGHAITIMGWRDDWFVLKNSWGENWGLGGHCYFHKDFPIWDCWISLDMSDKLPVEERYGKPRNYPAEKITAFNPWLIKKIRRLPSNIEINGLLYGKWGFPEVFKGRVGDKWLYEIKKFK
ncbi:hypothetical protein HY469_02535 [Candidatus Roizmanbacteria bacterium]|nr:hypothetical protein [Candidatus Roizmanbacteria bacterium]